MPPPLKPMIPIPRYTFSNRPMCFPLLEKTVTIAGCTSSGVDVVQSRAVTMGGMAGSRGDKAGIYPSKA